VDELTQPGAWTRHEARGGGGVIVDALLGTGLRRAPEGLFAEAIADLAVPLARAVLAVDLPSGVPSDHGELEWTAARADVTVTFAAPKRGHVLPPACDRIGELVIADIGIPARLLASPLGLIEPSDVLAAFPPRLPSAHKGRFGHLLVVAGSLGKSGAAVLAGLAALRVGAGLVTVATPGGVLASVASGRPELMTEPLAEEGDGGLGREALDRVLELAAGRDALVLGPGLGQAGSTRGFVQELAAACDRPLLIDADGLNALAATGGGVAALRRRSSATLLTPHPGEMGRLLGRTASEVQTRRLECARELARQSGAVVALKGQRTLVTHPDGRSAVCPAGNPGMATGGTGDVLSGALGALLAQGRDAWEAACAGVFLHGAAGDDEAARRSQEGLLAGDLADALPRTLRRLRAGTPR
jgi:NAD(P)H-hydrate epimerase